MPSHEHFSLVQCILLLPDTTHIYMYREDDDERDKWEPWMTLSFKCLSSNCIDMAIQMSQLNDPDHISHCQITECTKSKLAIAGTMFYRKKDNNPFSLKFKKSSKKDCPYFHCYLKVFCENDTYSDYLRLYNK